MLSADPIRDRNDHAVIFNATGPERPASPPNPNELSLLDMEQVRGGAKGSGAMTLGSRVLSAMWAGSGFNPRNNQWWRTT
jgi:hypothetical protein